MLCDSRSPGRNKERNPVPPGSLSGRDSAPAVLASGSRQEIDCPQWALIQSAAVYVVSQQSDADEIKGGNKWEPDAGAIWGDPSGTRSEARGSSRRGRSSLHLPTLLRSSRMSDSGGKK